MKNYDVIIIGAGPSGIFCAYELLECYRSIVQCDGYAAYEQFEQMKGITGEYLLFEQVVQQLAFLHRHFIPSAQGLKLREKK